MLETEADKMGRQCLKVGVFISQGLANREPTRSAGGDTFLITGKGDAESLGCGESVRA